MHHFLQGEVVGAGVLDSPIGGHAGGPEAVPYEERVHVSMVGNDLCVIPGVERHTGRPLRGSTLITNSAPWRGKNFPNRVPGRSGHNTPDIRVQTSIRTGDRREMPRLAWYRPRFLPPPS